MAGTIKQQEETIRNLLQQHVHRTINREHEAFVDILEIMMAQDQWLDKLDTIQAFKVTRSRLNKALILQVRVNNFARWLTVSWRKGSSKKRKEEDPLQSAFRQAIYRQIMLWKKTFDPGECAECKDVQYAHLKLHVDHKDFWKNLSIKRYRRNLIIIINVGVSSRKKIIDSSRDGRIIIGNMPFYNGYVENVI
jgi:hypothetical protein